MECSSVPPRSHAILYRLVCFFVALNFDRGWKRHDSTHQITVIIMGKYTLLLFVTVRTVHTRHVVVAMCDVRCAMWRCGEHSQFEHCHYCTSSKCGKHCLIQTGVTVVVSSLACTTAPQLPDHIEDQTRWLDFC
jgi:glucose uptake protein GlcU